MKTNLKIYPKIMLLIYLVSLVSHAQDRSMLAPISISNAIQNALTHHPLSLIAVKDVELAKENVHSARADLIGGANATYNFSVNQNPIQMGVGDARLGFAGVSISQPLINVSSWYALGAAKERFKIALLNAKGDALVGAGQVTRTYLDVLQLRITLDLAKEHYYSTDALITEMISGSLREKATAKDINLARAALATAKAEKHRWIGDADISENNFERDTLFITKNYFLNTPIPLPTPKTPEEAYAIAQANSPALEADQVAIKAAEKDVKSAKAGRLPRVDAFASVYNFQRGAGDFKGLNLSGNTAGVSVSIPLFDKKRGHIIASQKINQKKSELKLQNDGRDLAINFRNFFVKDRERETLLVGLCQGLKERLATVEWMSEALLKTVTVQDLLAEKRKLLDTAVQLNSELLAEVMDSFNLQIQMGTLMENLPPLVSASEPEVPNPHLQGREAYKGLIERCSVRKFLDHPL